VERTRRLAVLVSGSGTNLQALLDAIATDRGFGGEIVVVGSDRPGCGGLGRAQRVGIATTATAVDDHPDREAWEAALTTALAEHDPEIVVLAGFMRILSGRFLARWPDRVVNVHPSLLPAFPGAHAVRDALAHGVKVTGCTVHFVDEGVDTGPIIAQRAVEVRDEDDESALHERIKDVERGLLVEAVGRLARDGYRIEGRKVHIP
jgi:phosphoribosylglycinamide formyltransferase 1